MSLKRWKTQPKSRILGRGRGETKPPKLRFSPGQFFRQIKKIRDGYEVGQLYCLMWVYRLEENPSVWLHVLEERKNLKNPGTPLSIMCDAVMASRGESQRPMSDRVMWQPLFHGWDLPDQNDYLHGSRILMNTKEMLNYFELVSDGEVVDCRTK